MKIHHAITDGVGGMKIQLELLDLDPHAPLRDMPPAPEVHVMSQPERFFDAFNHERRRQHARRRVLHVLAQGPLCVCHFQEILREPQVKISKHLAYLRARGMVACERQGNWMIYRLPAKPAAG